MLDSEIAGGGVGGSARSGVGALLSRAYGFERRVVVGCRTVVGGGNTGGCETPRCSLRKAALSTYTDGPGDPRGLWSCLANSCFFKLAIDALGLLEG